MQHITIVNLRNTKAYDFRCDRLSPVGNPFTMYNEAERDLVCDKYEEYFNKQIQTNGKFIEYINKITQHYQQHGSVTLACWCSPKRCHCKTIRDWVLNQ